MNDSDLTKLIADIAKAQDQERDDASAESWDRMTRGQLDDQALAKLIADTEDEDPEVLQELYRPIDDERLDAIVDKVVNALPDQEPTSHPSASAKSPTASIWRYFKLWHAVPVGVAALALFVLNPAIPPPPNYSLDIAGQIASERSSAGESMRFAVGNTMVLTLRPDLATDADVYAATSLQLSDGRILPLDARVEVSASGAIQITWPVEWDPQIGNVSAVLVVLSTEADALNQEMKVLENNVNARIFKRPLEIVPQP